MQLRLLRLTCCSCVMYLVLMGACPVARSQMFINEVYLDPPGSFDATYEYIELRGTPGASLADHYLVILENETGTPTANPGRIEAVFDLGSLGVTLGTNGYLTLRQAGNIYTNLDPQSTNLENTLTAGTWGSGPMSSVGFTDENNDGVLENSGGTFMLIQNQGGTSSAPSITSPNLIDLDADDDNELDPGTILESWTILDAIGINGESSDVGGFLYAPINFSAGTPVGGGNVPAGATFVDVGFEIEYFARWGNSTGSTPADWHTSNLTDNPASGYDGGTDFRQAGSPHGVSATNQKVESSQGLPYGTKLLDNLGSANLFVLDGDFDAVYDGEEYVFDGEVDGKDFLHWQRNYGFGSNLYATRRHGDANRDRTVNGGDLTLWAANYGTSLSPLTAAVTALPEPTSLTLLATVGAMLLGVRRG